ncbi:MAG: hypothetical protein R3C53_18020 [Pirellulaceae bacterium]
MQAGQGQFNRGQLRQHSTVTGFVRVLPLMLIVLGTLFNSGCSRLRLPAIDPTGSRIFLPLPNTTTLNVPQLHERNGQPGILPNSAFPTPPAPPACLDGSCESPGGFANLFHHKHKLASKVHDHFRSPGKSGEIQLTPLRVLAPVGGEVVLLAGICGKDGYLVKRQPLEWMLSPDSVGQFIEVGDDRPGKLAGLIHHKGPDVEKLDVDFARGRTSSKEELITRGTPTCEDDIQLREGETWLSISSPTEGISRVTVLAPESDCWDQRRQTATIYWIDAGITFPTPQITRAGEVAQLVTRVTKSENLVPATDWDVIYTIVDPSVAAFSPPTGSNVARVKVNSDGQAIANIVAQPNSRGTTAVVMEVIRPAMPSDSLPAVPLRRETTYVTFSAPGLGLQVYGPEVGSTGEQLTYSASLGNPGDIDAENTRLSVALPAGTKLIDARPQPTTATNSAVVWDQGLLAAGRQLDVWLVLEALQPNTFDVVFQAEGAGLAERQTVRTQIVDATVDVKFAPIDGVAQAEVGNVVEYGIDVTNTGRQTLTDLKLLIETTPGLPEAYQGINRVEQTISMLQPGSTASRGVAFAVRQEGQQTAKLTISSGNKILSEQTTSILGLPPRQKQPNIGVSLQFPEAMQVGQAQNAQITLSNPGEVPLTGLQVEIVFDQAVNIGGVDQQNFPNFKLAPDRRSALWTPQDLLPRSSGGGDPFRQLLISFSAIAPADSATIRTRATAVEGVQAEDTATFRIVNNQIEPPATPPAVEPPAVRTGGLEVLLSDFGDPTIVGNQFRYGLRIFNNSNQPDRNVHVELLVPPGIELLEASSDGTPVARTRAQDNIVVLPTIQYMRPGMSVDYIMIARPTVPQVVSLEARAYSDNERTPITAAESHTVNARAN